MLQIRPHLGAGEPILSRWYDPNRDLAHIGPDLLAIACEEAVLQESPLTRDLFARVSTDDIVSEVRKVREFVTRSDTIPDYEKLFEACALGTGNREAFAALGALVMMTTMCWFHKGYWQAQEAGNDPPPNVEQYAEWVEGMIQRAKTKRRSIIGKFGLWLARKFR